MLTIYVMFEDMDHNQPTVEALNEYAVEHGIGYPLLIDTDGSIWNRFEQDGYMPSFTVFTPGPVIEAIDMSAEDLTEARVQDWLGI